MKKSKSVFIDSNAFIALNFHKHPNYKKAVELATYIKEENIEVFTCTYVLLEVATIMNMYFEHNREPVIVQEIIDNPKVNLVAGDRFLEAGIEKMRSQTSINVSLNDCVYFSIVENLKIDSVFSFDKHWKKNGLMLLN